MELSLKHVHPLAVLAASSTCSVRGLRAKGGPGGKWHSQPARQARMRNTGRAPSRTITIDITHSRAHDESKYIDNSQLDDGLLLQMHPQHQQWHQDCQHLHAPLPAPSCILSRQERSSTAKEEAGHNLELAKDRWQQQRWRRERDEDRVVTEGGSRSLVLAEHSQPLLTPLLLVSTHRCCTATMQAYAKPTI